MLFTELPFMARFEAAARAGFRAVEFLFPYEFTAEDIARELRRHNLAVSLFNLRPGDYAAGERGLAALPGREAEFAESVELALEYARTLGCQKVHAMSGLVPAGQAREECAEVWLANMRAAADRLAPSGITLLAEALNPRDVPGYFLLSQRECARLVRLAARPNFRLQFDVYHAQITDGDLTALLRSLADCLGHVQIAAVPSRHEPDEGEVNYCHIFQLLDDLGYPGWIGCEYRPRAATEAGLGWLKILGNS
jgi:hydroxypyruvate isomerase